MRRRPMRRAVAALAGLAALLVLPASHGALGHGHALCPAGPAQECAAAGSAARLGSVAGALPCPLCLARSQARTLLEPRAATPAAVRTPDAALALPPAPAPPAPRALAVSAPRAPPARLSDFFESLES